MSTLRWVGAVGKLGFTRRSAERLLICPAGWWVVGTEAPGGGPPGPNAPEPGEGHSSSNRTRGPHPIFAPTLSATRQGLRTSRSERTRGQRGAFGGPGYREPTTPNPVWHTDGKWAQRPTLSCSPLTTVKNFRHPVSPSWGNRTGLTNQTIKQTLCKSTDTAPSPPTTP